MPTIGRIVYLVGTPFNRRDYKRFGIEVLRANGFDVRVFDITAALSPDRMKTVAPSDAFCYEGLSTLDSVAAVCDMLSGCTENDVIVDLCDLHYSSRKVLRVLSRNNLRFGTAPFPIPSMEFKTTSKHLLWKMRCVKPMKAIEWFMLRKGFGLRPYFFSLCAGSEAFRTCNTRMYKRPLHLIATHSLDYDVHLEKACDVRTNGRPFIVFLDSYVPFHPDWISECGSYPHFAEKYYRKMCDFFDRVESETHMRVVVAAHPRSAYDALPDYWDGRAVTRGMTYELVRDAEFCITNASTAVTYGVILKKPLLFVTMSEIENVVGALTRSFARELGTEMIHLDESELNTFDVKRHLDISPERYDAYMETYVKTKGSPEKNSWLIMTDYLRAL